MVLIVKVMVFSSNNVQMQELDHKEGWCQRIDAFELWCWRRLLRVPWTARRSNQSILKEISPEYSLEGWIDGKAEPSILWPTNAKTQLIGNDPDAGKDWGQEERRATEYEMVGWHHQLNEHEFGQTPGDTEGQGSLACCPSWVSKKSDTTKLLNNTNKWFSQ